MRKTTAIKKSLKTVLLCALFGGFLLGLTWRQDRNFKVVAKTADGKVLPLYKASYALVVGVANYTNGWPKLTEAVNDAREVKAALEQQGFIVTLVENPTAVQLRFALENFVTTRGLDENNRLLFYFAGHGDTQKKSYGSDMGYIVAADAPLSRQDPTGFLQKALSMENFNTYAREINAKHVLFLFDSCFSGSIFALSRAVPDIISYKTSQPVRQFITAGSANEPVPDKSIFKQQFLAALQGEGDANRDGYVTGNELGEFLQTKVVNYSREAQHPQYGKIRDPKLDKGDFVFEVPVALPPEAKFDPSVYETEANRFAAAKAQWDKWQSAMNTGFQKTQSLDGNPNLTAASKAQMWQEFLTAYADNNPYSSEDETMRREAGNRQNYWRAYQPAKVEPARNESLAPTDMVLIPAGSFMMGDNNSSYDDEKPEHQVSVEAFYLDIYEVTVKKFKDFIEATGYKTDAEKNNDDKNWRHDANGEIISSAQMNRPVIRVSWNDAQAYTKWVKKRLPTEAEWEYAARGGFTGLGGKPRYEYPWGNEASHERANYFGTEGKDQWDRTSPVGVFAPNGFGLYDMAGNVWEWCSSLYTAYPYKRDDGRENLTTSGQRLLRGGSWGSNTNYVRCAYRGGSMPTNRDDLVGFRCAQDVR